MKVLQRRVKLHCGVAFLLLAANLMIPPGYRANTTFRTVRAAPSLARTR